MKIYLITEKNGVESMVLLATTAKANVYCFCNTVGNLDFNSRDYFYEIWENEELLIRSQFYKDTAMYKCLS